MKDFSTDGWEPKFSDFLFYFFQVLWRPNPKFSIYSKDGLITKVSYNIKLIKSIKFLESKTIQIPQNLLMCPN